MSSAQYLLIMNLTVCSLYSSADSQALSSSKSCVKSAYWPSGSISYRPPSSINATLYTHIFYAFADLDDQTFEVNVSSDKQKIIQEFTPSLLKNNPSLKTLVSIGGGASNATAFALMASAATSRAVFINSAIALARRYGFHGLDLDWEFPRNTTDMENLGMLFSEWRNSIELEATSSAQPPLLLTAAVYFAHHFLLSAERRAYPTTSIAKNLDWVNVMCFDYHGSWDTSATGAPAALNDLTSNVSTSYGIGSWLDSGLPPQKVVMGMPLYGHSWTLKSQNETGIGAPAVAAGPKQNLSNDAGIMFFSEIQDFIREKNATEVFDKATVSAYSYAEDVWVGYDNEESVAGKIEFARQKGLLGYFFWAISQDSHWMLSSTASVSWSKCS